MFGEEPGIPEMPQQNNEAHNNDENIDEPQNAEEDDYEAERNNEVPVQEEPLVPPLLQQPVWNNNEIVNNEELVVEAAEGEENYGDDDIDGAGVAHPPQNIVEENDDGENGDLPEDDPMLHNAQGAPDDGGWNPDAIMEDLTWEKVI